MYSPVDLLDDISPSSSLATLALGPRVQGGLVAAARARTQDPLPAIVGGWQRSRQPWPVTYLSALPWQLAAATATPASQWAQQLAAGPGPDGLSLFALPDHRLRVELAPPLVARWLLALAGADPPLSTATAPRSLSPERLFALQHLHADCAQIWVQFAQAWSSQPAWPALAAGGDWLPAAPADTHRLVGALVQGADHLGQPRRAVPALEYLAQAAADWLACRCQEEVRTPGGMVLVGAVRQVVRAGLVEHLGEAAPEAL